MMARRWNPLRNGRQVDNRSGWLYKTGELCTIWRCTIAAPGLRAAFGKGGIISCGCWFAVNTKAASRELAFLAQQPYAIVWLRLCQGHMWMLIPSMNLYCLSRSTANAMLLLYSSTVTAYVLSSSTLMGSGSRVVNSSGFCLNASTLLACCERIR